MLGFGQKIYQGDSAKEAQVKVFAVEEPEEADLWVCFVWEEEELTRTGLWMDMRYPHEAEIIIFFVDEESEADLKIWLVDTIEESKWLNEKKKNLLALKKQKI
jgi:hypothetical protein